MENVFMIVVCVYLPSSWLTFWLLLLFHLLTRAKALSRRTTPFVPRVQVKALSA